MMVFQELNAKQQVFRKSIHITIMFQNIRGCRTQKRHNRFPSCRGRHEDSAYGYAEGSCAAGTPDWCAYAPYAGRHRCGAEAAAGRRSGGACSPHEDTEDDYPEAEQQALLPGQEKDPVGRKVCRKAAQEGECQTCKERKYQDGSDDPGVSFKTAAHIAPEAAGAAVRGHEMEHVVREQAKAQRKDAA